MRRVNAQISMEFILMTTAIIAFSISILAIISYYNTVEITHKSSDSVINVLEFLQNEVILATKLEDGYIKSFDIPEKINNQDYAINIHGSDLIITYDGREYLRIIPAVTGDFNIPNNTIKKISNEIFIN